MDTEEDRDAPSPRRDSKKSSFMASEEESYAPDRPSAQKQSARSDVLANEVQQSVEGGYDLNKGRQAQCRLTGDYTGSLIVNYMSDISEDSEDLEPSRDLGIADSIEAAGRESGEESKLPRQDCLKPTTAIIMNVSCSEAAGHINTYEVDEQEVMVAKGSENGGDEQGDMGRVACDKGAFQAAFSENAIKEIRKRSRSPERTKSNSPLRGHIQSPTTTRSRSASPSNEAKNKSLSPSRVILQDSLGRLLPKRSPGKNAERGSLEFTTRPHHAARRGGNNCVNHDRDRCFQGDSCRLEHPVSDKVFQGHDQKDIELEHNEVSKLTDSSPNLQKNAGLELCNNAEPSAELAATRRSKRKAGSRKVAKRQEFMRETANMLGGLSQEDLIKQDLFVQENAGQQPSPPEGKVDTAPKGDLLHVKAFQASEAGALSPLPPPETGMRVMDNYGSSSRFHNDNTLQFSGFTGTSRLIPTNNTYASTNNEANKLYAQNYPGLSGQFSSAGRDENAGFHRPYGSLRMVPSAASARNPAEEYTDLARNFVPSFPKEYRWASRTQSGTTQNNLVSPPAAFPPAMQQRELLTDTTIGYPSLQQGYTSSFALRAQLHDSPRPPPFSGESSRQSMFPDAANHEPLSLYPKSSFSFSSQSQNYSPWVNSVSSGFSSSKVGDVSSALGNSMSYSYSLTTIPPLPSIIELPGASKPSNPGDQYDPLSDSLEPSSNAGSKSISFTLLKAVEDAKVVGDSWKTVASQLGHVAYDAVKGDPAELAGDPIVGIVENVSPPEENRVWSPGPLVEAIDTKQDQVSAKNKKIDARGLTLLRSAVADHVKEVLKPTWKEGRMSKDAFKNIVKKAVDKVTDALSPHHAPKSQEKVDQFMLSSRRKIAKLVQGYIDKYQKN